MCAAEDNVVEEYAYLAKQVDSNTGDSEAEHLACAAAAAPLKVWHNQCLHINPSFMGLRNVGTGQ